jgi:hypothetical protein
MTKRSVFAIGSRLLLGEALDRGVELRRDRCPPCRRAVPRRASGGCAFGAPTATLAWPRATSVFVDCSFRHFATFTIFQGKSENGRRTEK